MIIDSILERYNGKPYCAKSFYNEMMAYGEIAFDITYAMDYGENADIRKVLCDYIEEGNYNLKIKDFINAADWLTDDDGKRWENEINIMAA